MNGAGDRISVGAVYSGTCGAVTSVKIYEYNSESWIQLGTDYCNIGYAVKMSSNGNFIGIANGGAIKAYKYNPRGIWFVWTCGSHHNSRCSLNEDFPPPFSANLNRGCGIQCRAASGGARQEISHCPHRRRLVGHEHFARGDCAQALPSGG